MSLYRVMVIYATKRGRVGLGMRITADSIGDAQDKARDKATKGYPSRKFIYCTACDITCDALVASLKEMIECYGSDDGGGPIPIIERAKAALAGAGTGGSAP